MIKDMCVMRVPIISTGHLKPKTVRDIHMTVGTHGIVAEYDWGFFIYVGDEDVSKGWPEDLARAANWAQTLGFSWLRFDSSGDVVPDLPDYSVEW